MYPSTRLSFFFVLKFNDQCIATLVRLEVSHVSASIDWLIDWLIDLLTHLLILCTKGDPRSFSKVPPDPTNVNPGKCVTLTWKYTLVDGDQISKVRFGEFVNPPFLKKTIVTVRSNTNIYILSTYKSRVSWIGNFDKKNAAVRFCNVTQADEKMYGVEIDIRGTTTLKSGVQLNVIGKIFIVDIINYLFWEHENNIFC